MKQITLFFIIFSLILAGIVNYDSHQSPTGKECSRIIFAEVYSEKYFDVYAKIINSTVFNGTDNLPRRKKGHKDDIFWDEFDTNMYGLLISEEGDSKHKRLCKFIRSQHSLYAVMLTNHRDLNLLYRKN